MATLESVRLGGVILPTVRPTAPVNTQVPSKLRLSFKTDPLQLLTGALDTWKETAAYFSRSVRCVQRWELLGAMPVHRHQHRWGASVYAYRLELDAWWNAGSAFVDTLANQG